MRPLFVMITLLLGLGESAAGARVSGASSHLKQKTRVMEWSGSTPKWRPATFQPASAMDGSLATAWCEGARGTGAGEWIGLEVEVPIGALEFELGFRKVSLPESAGGMDPEKLQAWFDQSLSNYLRNGRPAVLELLDGRGRVLERLRLGDRSLGHYRFAVHLEPGKYRLRIAEVNRGTRFEDTCIAEIRVHEEKEPVASGELPSALKSFGGHVSCGAGANAEAKVLPRELIFLGYSVHSMMSASRAEIEVEVRSNSSELLPITRVTCHWGPKSTVVACNWSGEETGAESLDDASVDAPEWSGTLQTDAFADGPRMWRGAHRKLGTEPLEIEITLHSPTDGIAPLVVSATRNDRLVERVRYVCSSAY